MKRLNAALSNFSTVVQELFAQLPATSVVTGACLGMSGVDREPEKLRWSEAATRLLRIDLSRVRVSNDAVTALASGTGGRLEGISLIAGTGTIALGMHAGLSVRAQGWGPVLGDEGSGYAVGQAALRAVARALRALCGLCASATPWVVAAVRAVDAGRADAGAVASE